MGSQDMSCSVEGSPSHVVLFHNELKSQQVRLLKTLQGCKLQNHRVVEVRRDLWRASGPTPLLKQGHPEPVAQDHVQTDFQYL